MTASSMCTRAILGTEPQSFAGTASGAEFGPRFGPRLARGLQLGLLALALPLLAACSLPRGAATTGEILRSANDETADVQVVEVTRAQMAHLARWPQIRQDARINWPSASAQRTARTIRAGDRVNLSIWDSQPDPLFTTPAQRVSQMENLTVSNNGQIFVPYLGDVRISGLTAEAARSEIQRQIGPVVPDAQVQLQVAPGGNNTIDVVTGVATPGRIALEETSPSILSVIAQSGGISPSLRNPIVRLNRAGQGYVIPAETLFAEPARDIPLRGGDRILVEADRRSYIALGASGRQQVVYFEREDVSALDALSTIGGLAPTRANLQGLMVLRQYAPSQVRETGDYPRKTSVIFSFNLGEADGLFAARNFQIEPEDVVLATESAAPAFLQVIAMLRTVRSLE